MISWEVPSYSVLASSTTSPRLYFVVAPDTTSREPLCKGQHSIWMSPSRATTQWDNITSRPAQESPPHAVRRTKTSGLCPADQHPPLPPWSLSGKEGCNAIRLLIACLSSTAVAANDTGGSLRLFTLARRLFGGVLLLLLRSAGKDCSRFCLINVYLPFSGKFNMYSLLQ